MTKGCGRSYLVAVVSVVALAVAMADGSGRRRAARKGQCSNAIGGRGGDDDASFADVRAAGDGADLVHAGPGVVDRIVGRDRDRSSGLAESLLGREGVAGQHGHHGGGGHARQQIIPVSA